MSKTTRYLSLALLLVLFASPALPQTAKEQRADPTLDALLSELRLLRIAVERNSAMLSRVLLHTTRLGILEQTVSGLQYEQQRLDGEETQANKERGSCDGTLAEFQRTLERETDAVRRSEIESQIRQVRAQRKQIDTTLADIANRRAQLELALETARQRHEQSEAQLLDLDRELEGQRR